MSDPLVAADLPTEPNSEDLVAASIQNAIPRGGTSLPTVRRTFYLECWLGRRMPDASPEEVLRRAAKLVIDWFDDKVPGHLSNEIYGLKSDHLDQEGLHTVRTIGLQEDGSWAGWVRYADRARFNQPAVAGRMWKAEVVLRVGPSPAKGAGNVRACIQMFMVTRPGADRSLDYDAPDIVSALEKELGLFDLYALPPKVVDITAQQLEHLVDHPARKRPVVVLTKSDSSSISFPYVLDRTALGLQLLGIAWAVALSPEETFRWTEVVGKGWTVYNGAVMTYKPLIDWENDEIYSHPRVFPDKIDNWVYAGRIGEDAFRAFLVEQCVKDACQERFIPSPDMTFASVEAADLARRREAAHYGELLPLAEEEIEALKSQVAELRTREETLALDLDVGKERVDADRNTIQILLAENDRLRGKLAARSATEAQRTLPQQLAEVPDWAQEQFAGRLVLHPRAIRELKHGHFEDVQLISRAIEILAIEGRSWLQSETGAKERLDLACQVASLIRPAKSISEHRAGEQGDAYFVDYPKGSAQKRFLEWHIGKGNERNERTCLRIYFFWDEPSQTVVVGWLPSHLPIRST
jgi:hypothetical protein